MGGLLQQFARALIAAEPELRKDRCHHHDASSTQHDNHIAQPARLFSIQLAGIEGDKNNLRRLDHIAAHHHAHMVPTGGVKGAKLAIDFQRRFR